MPQDAAPIRFYFDYISPYAYLAWTQIHAIAERYGREVAPVPILFAGLLNAHGQKGPAEIPAKRIYVFKDALRRATLLGLTLSPPPTHPFNPLVALRASALAPEGAPKRALIDALFAATWGGQGGIDTPAKVSDAATSVGLDGPALLAAAEAPEIKAGLRADTDAAISAGVFGVPTMIIEHEVFWGFDSLELLDLYLAGNDPLARSGIDPEKLQRWRGIQPSASRLKG